jgi:hypothetical protein
MLVIVWAALNKFHRKMITADLKQSDDFWLSVGKFRVSQSWRIF